MVIAGVMSTPDATGFAGHLLTQGEKGTLGGHGMSAQHDSTRRSLARVAGLALMVWGIGWAVLWALAAIGLFAFAIWSAASGGGGGEFLIAPRGGGGGGGVWGVRAGTAKGRWGGGGEGAS